MPSHLISISFDEDALTGKAVALTADTDDCKSTTEGSARVELAVFIKTSGSDRANAMVVDIVKKGKLKRGTKCIVSKSIQSWSRLQQRRLLETWSLCGITSNVTCATLVLEEVIFP